MIQEIQKAIQFLQNGHIAAYFETLDALPIPATLQHTYSNLKRKFTTGDFNSLFDQQLTTFAKTLMAELPLEAIQPQPPDQTNTTQKYNINASQVTIIESNTNGNINITPPNPT